VSTRTTPTNPARAWIRTLPDDSGHIVSMAARAVGAALAAWIAVTVGFTPTRLLAAFLAAAATLSLVPLPGRWFVRLPWHGAGALFFGGALLAHLPAGVAIAALGALAALAEVVDDVQRDRPTGVPSFFTGFGIVAVAVIALMVLLR
jgi:hypothetical protein